MFFFLLSFSCPPSLPSLFFAPFSAHFLPTGRLREDPEGAGSPLGVDESLFSYGLRESIASYLSLTGEDNTSFDRKKKSLSLMYSGSKRKSSFFSSPPYFED